MRLAQASELLAEREKRAPHPRNRYHHPPGAQQKTWSCPGFLFFLHPHKPSADAVDSASRTYLKHSFFSSGLVITAMQEPPSSPLFYLLESTLHTTASVAFGEVNPVTPPVSSKSPKGFSPCREENPNSAPCPLRPGPHPLPHSPPCWSHSSVPAWVCSWKTPVAAPRGLCTRCSLEFFPLGSQAWLLCII